MNPLADVVVENLIVELSKEQKQVLFFQSCDAIAQKVCQQTIYTLMLNFKNPQKTLDDYQLVQNPEIDPRVTKLFNFIMVDATALMAQNMFTKQMLLGVTTEECNLLKHFGLPLVQDVVTELDAISPQIVDDAIAIPLQPEWIERLAEFKIKV